MIRNLKRAVHLLLGALVSTVLAAGAAMAAPWPSKPVRIVNPFPAGGAADIVARALAQRLTEQLGQSFIVENRTGAGGNLGTEVVARSAADGYTLLLGTDHLTISRALYPKLGYDLFRDLAPVSLTNYGPHVLVAHPSFPADTLAQTIALAKAKPGEIAYASAGTGTAQHLAGEMFKRMAGIDMLHVPYKGGAPAIQDLLGGQIKIGVIGLPPIVGHIRNGKLKALGVTSPKRSPLLPDVPSISEVLPGFQSVQWMGLVVPAATPSEVIAKLAAETSKAIDDAQMKERLAQIGNEAVGGTPAEFARFIAEDLARWEKVIREAGVKVD